MKKYILLLVTALMINGLSSCHNEKKLPDTILNNFHLLETSMNQSYNISEERTYRLFNYLKSSTYDFPEKVSHLHDSAEVAVKETKTFVEFIEQLQKNLETNTGGRLENGRLAGGNEMLYHQTILFGEGMATELKQRINSLRMKFTELLDSSDRHDFRTQLYVVNDSVSRQS